MKNALAVSIIAGITTGCSGGSVGGVSLPCNFKIPAISGNIDPSSGSWSTAATETNKFSEARKSRQVKVSISDFVSDDSSLRGQVSRQVRDTMAGVVSGAGVGIVDRSVSAAMQNEIIAAERANQRISSARSKYIDFALVGTMNDPTYSAELGTVGVIDALNFAKDGVQAKKGDPVCRYKATVRGTLKLYRIASREVVREWTMEGRSSDSDPNPGIKDCTRGTIKKAELMGRAAESAVKKVQNEPLQWLRPVGYVLERKQDSKGRSIFRTSIGSGAGILDARTVSIIQKQPFDDPIEKRTVIDEVTLVQSANILRKHVNDNYSWIYVKDEAKANAIKIGDVVEQKGTCS